jgi:tRNA (cmo5U34)-methyltransferase
MKTSRHLLSGDGWDPHVFSARSAQSCHYSALQEAVVDATRDLEVTTVLDLGIGTGETTRRLLEVHKDATVVGIDASRAMLDVAEVSLPPERTTLIQGRIEESLPPGPFDLVVSVLAIHHLEGPGKAVLFDRISHVLAPRGRFVLGDIVLDPQMPEHHRSRRERLRRSLGDRGISGTAYAACSRLWRRMTPSPQAGNIHRDYLDLLVDQTAWLIQSGLRAEVVWDLDRRVVVTADKPNPSHASP